MPVTRSAACSHIATPYLPAAPCLTRMPPRFLLCCAFGCYLARHQPPCPATAKHLSLIYFPNRPPPSRLDVVLHLLGSPCSASPPPSSLVRSRFWLFVGSLPAVGLRWRWTNAGWLGTSNSCLRSGGVMRLPCRRALCQQRRLYLTLPPATAGSSLTLNFNALPCPPRLSACCCARNTAAPSQRFPNLPCYAFNVVPV